MRLATPGSFARDKDGHEIKDPDRPDRYLTGYDFKKIFVDGVEVRMVFAFDTDEGWVDHYPLDSNGHTIPIRDKNGDIERLETKRTTGKVTFTLDDKR